MRLCHDSSSPQVKDEREVDYYHQEQNIQVALRFAERRKTQDLRKLKMREMHGIKVEVPATHQRKKIRK